MTVRVCTGRRSAHDSLHGDSLESHHTRLCCLLPVGKTHRKTREQSDLEMEEPHMPVTCLWEVRTDHSFALRSNYYMHCNVRFLNLHE